MRKTEAEDLRLATRRSPWMATVASIRSCRFGGLEVLNLMGMLLLALVISSVSSSGSQAHAASAEDSEARGFSQEEIRFESREVTLHGTILVPDEASPRRKPAIVLVHGAGPGLREQYRQEAEVFVRRGLVVLVYDKRTEGYSQTERSYELLADDALAAVRILRTHPEVDPEAVGLWGLSEGGWVVPIAASRSDKVDFVVLVAASGVSPARQHAWNLENEMRHQGVSGSMVEAISRTGTRLLVGAGMFAEANHDPLGPLEQVRQPVLALWGEKDRIAPPAESARIVREALERGGNTHYTIRTFPDAEHGLRSSPDGFVAGEDLAPEYPQTVASWVKEVVRGETPGPSVAGPAAEQARLSLPLAPLAWWESVWVQLGAMVTPFVAFVSYPAVALVRILRSLLFRRGGTRPQPSTRIAARWLAVAGTTTLVGFVCYFGFLVFTAASEVGPVVAGRSLAWLTLQLLAVMACVSTVGLALLWWPARKLLSRVDQGRIGILLVGGAVFAVWAAYWGLLVP